MVIVFKPSKVRQVDRTIFYGSEHQPVLPYYNKFCSQHLSHGYACLNYFLLKKIKIKTPVNPTFSSVCSFSSKLLALHLFETKNAQPDMPLTENKNPSIQTYRESE